MDSITILMYITHALAVVILVMSGAWCSSMYLGGFKWDGSDDMMNYHIFFMIIGMVVLYGEAALMYRVFKSMDKYKVKVAHGVTYLTSFIFIVTGLVAVFRHKNAEGKTNMSSAHSWAGLTTVLMFCLQLVLGFSGFLWPKFSPKMRAAYLNLHQFFGSGIFIMVGATCVSGVGEAHKHGVQGAEPPFKRMGNALGLLIMSFILLILYIMQSPKEVLDEKMMEGTDNKSYNAKAPAVKDPVSTA